MLTDDERTAFLQSIARVRQRAVQVLRQAQGADGADGAVAFIAQLHRGLDTVAEQARATGPRPACQAGCAHCCHLRVEATEPEVFRIAQHLRALPAEARADAAHALQRHVSSAALNPTNPARQACSFLVDDRCSIYPVRPAACRKAHSLSAPHCAEQSATIPQNLRLLVDAEALMAGTALAFQDQSLPASAHELNTAVLAALTDPAALHRWYQGDPATLGPALAQDPHTAHTPQHP